MTLSAGVVSLQQQTHELANLAQTKNPRTMGSEEKAEFYETINKICVIVDREKSAIWMRQCVTTEVDPQVKNGDETALAKLYLFLLNLKFPYGKTALGVTFVEERRMEVILFDNTSTILDIRKAAGKAFDVPLDFAKIMVDNKLYPDDQECVAFFKGTSIIRLHLKPFEIQ